MVRMVPLSSVNLLVKTLCNLRHPVVRIILYNSIIFIIMNEHAVNINQSINQSINLWNLM